MEIRWDDHWSYGGWISPDSSLEANAFQCESVGYFVGVNKISNCITLALNHGINNDSVGDVMHIMIPSITSIKILRR